MINLQVARQRGLPLASALLIFFTLISALIVPGQALAATQATYYVSPTGNDANPGTRTAPFQTILKARDTIRLQNSNMTGDIVVYLLGGTYYLNQALTFNGADSGTNGYYVRYEAYPNTQPVLSGGSQVTNWSLYDQGKNIYAANVGTGVNSRQLYVDGKLATLARKTVNHSDLTATATGWTMTNTTLMNALQGLPNQSQIEFESVNSFTDRYSPVQSINGNAITMQQPAWDNNTFGWDTMSKPVRNGPFYIKNSYSFIDEPGEWYLDTSSGWLYYKPLVGQNMQTANVVLPKLQSLVQIGGTYDNPVHNVTFKGMQFSHTTWLQPSTEQGYASQQTGAFMVGTNSRPADALTSCQMGCQLFEATRPFWNQMPAAVQVSAANHIEIRDSVFVDLGQVGLGIGNDANAHASGVGLGAQNIVVDNSTFTEISGGGIVIGGVQADAHHPSDPRMIIENITVSNNVISNVAQEYRDMTAILATYTSNAIIQNNDISKLPYSGICLGYGWGVNDPGGSPEYANRGLYNYQPIYSTPTTAKNNQILYNKISDVMKMMTDGGAFYTLSDNPGTLFKGNYISNTNGWYGLYFDEGSRHFTIDSNVFESIARLWAHYNANSTNYTGDITLTNNWTTYSRTDMSNGVRGVVLTGTTVVTNNQWPIGAKQVMYYSGVTPSLRQEFKTIQLEAENAALSGGAKVNQDHAGYTGSGFVDGYWLAGAKTTFTVNDANAELYKLSVKYSAGRGGRETASLYVNGVKIKQLGFTATANWDTWGNLTEDIALNEGQNTITIQRDSADSGWINFDSVTLDNKYEAENAALSSGAVVNSDHMAYSGTGFVAGYGNQGATTTFTVNNVTNGTHMIQLRYSAGRGNTETASLYVNGTKVKQLSFETTGSWDLWSKHTEIISLPAGQSTIAVKYDAGDSGWINLDHLTFINRLEAENADLSGGAVINVDHTGYSGSGFVAGYTNSGATTTFKLNSSFSGEFNLNIRYSSGLSSGQTASLYVNGVKVKQMSFASTGNWETWANHLETVTLASGNNTITIKRDTGDSGWINLDYTSIN